MKHSIEEAKHAKIAMDLAIEATKKSIAKKEEADKLHFDAIALHKKNVALRIHAEEMTEKYKVKAAHALAHGHKLKEMAIKFGLEAMKQKKLTMKFRVVIKKQNHIRVDAKKNHHL